MASRIEHRSNYPRDAATVYATLVDRTYLEQRLAALGGRDAAVLSHEASTGSASYRLRHSVDARELPQVIRTILSGNLMIDRAESWQRRPAGGYTGTVEVSIPGTPGELGGTLRLEGQGDGSTMTMAGTVSIPIPLLGGKIENSVGGHLRNLLDAEHEFTVRYLAEHT